MKKVLIISQYHPPEIGAAATRWEDYSRILARRGYEVTVLCEIPNYPTGITQKPYESLKAINETDDTGLYKIVRVPVWANPRKTTFQRMGFYLSFMVSAILALRNLKHYDYVILTSPPLFVGLVGVIYGKLNATKVFLDIRDLWPESAFVLGELNSRITRYLALQMEKQIYSMMDGFLIAVPGFRNYLNKFVQKPVIVNLPNGVSEKFIAKAHESNINRTKKFRVLYSGNIGLAQGLEIIVEVATILKDEPVDFIILGDGVKKNDLVSKVNELKLKNITFLSTVKRWHLIEEIKKASVCLVPLIDSKLFTNAIPSKMIEYMACERPVIATIPGEAKLLINNSQSGKVTTPEDPKELAAAIINYFENPEQGIIDGLNGYNFVIKNWVKEELVNPLTDLLEKNRG